MKILLVHEHYQQRGGEDEVFETEARLLSDRGHEVHRYEVSNDEIDASRPLRLATATIWNHAAALDLGRAIDRYQPDVAHFHNTFPLLSPASYVAAKRRGVAVVKTHHNYRLLCANGLLFRNGQVCESCVGALAPWRGAVRRCYRNSRAASAVVATTIGVHRALGTWRGSIDMHVALTNFARLKLIAAGLPSDRIAVKPNFVRPDPGAGCGGGGFALFVGRLSDEKGVEDLLVAWRSLGSRLPLRIVGDGPLAGVVARAAREIPGVEWLQRRPRSEVDELMRAAECVILPSRWFEGLSRVLIESLAAGTPVVVPAVGPFPDLVTSGENGLLFRAGDGNALAKIVADQLARPLGFARMRAASRACFEERYGESSNYRALMEVYRRARTAGSSADLNRAPAREMAEGGAA